MWVTEVWDVVTEKWVHDTSRAKMRLWSRVKMRRLGHQNTVMSVLYNPATCSHVEGGGVYGSRNNSATHPTGRWDCDPCKVKGTMYIPERKRDGLLSQLAAAGLHRHTDTMSGPWSSTAPPTN